MLIAVFDIGGTSIKYGVVDEQGEILFSSSLHTHAHLGGLQVVRNVITTAKELQIDWPIVGVSVSTAGQVDDQGRVIYASDNIPSYTGLHVQEMIAEHLNLPVVVENDANCAAIGEHWKGAAQGIDNFICITLGTGIGGAISLNGKVYTGSAYSAGEIGHMNLYPNGKPCSCGMNGCYEQYASSRALQMLVADRLNEPLSLTEFFQRVHAKDAQSLQVYERWLDDLTIGLKSMIHFLDPQLVVIGGGISEQGDRFLEAIKDALYPKLMMSHARNVQIKLAEQGNRAQLLGAAQNFFQFRFK